MNHSKSKLLADGINKCPHIQKIGGVYICIGVWFITDDYCINRVGAAFTPKEAYANWRTLTMQGYDDWWGIVTNRYDKDYTA